MKKLLIALLAGGLLAGCGSKADKEAAEKKAEEMANKLAGDLDKATGGDEKWWTSWWHWWVPLPTKERV